MIIMIIGRARDPEIRAAQCARSDGAYYCYYYYYYIVNMFDVYLSNV